MADIDLATILADGEYLKRDGDVLVGDIPATGGGTVAAAAVTYAGSTDLAATNVEAALDELDVEKQATSPVLTDLASKWVPASAAGPASLALFEDTDNGTNKITLGAPATLGSDFTVTVPGANGTICLLTAPQTLTTKTIALGSNTVSGTFAEFNTACTDADFAASIRTIVTYSAVSNTAVLTDGGKYVRFTGTNPTYTIPPNSSVAFPVGTVIAGISTTTAMTLIAGAGVTLVKSRTLVTTGAGSAWTAIKVATDTWDLGGDFV